MRWGISSYLFPQSEIRRRAVHLLFIIFLIVLFAFIPKIQAPAPISDEFAMLKVSEELHQISTHNTLSFLHLIQSNPEEYQDVKFRCLQIEQLGVKTARDIHAFQTSLKPHFAAALRPFIHIDELDVQTLFKKLSIYRGQVSELIDLDHQDELEALFPLEEFSTAQDGQLHNYYDRHFHRKTQEQVQAYLTYLAAKIEQLTSFALQRVIRDAAERLPHAASFDQVKLGSNEPLTALLRKGSIDEFFRNLEDGSIALSSNRFHSEAKGFRITALHESNPHVGEALIYHLDFKEGTEKINVLIQGIAGDFYYSIPSPGRFYFFPQHAGQFSLLFKNGEEEIRDVVHVAKQISSLETHSHIPLALSSKNSLELNENLIQLGLPLIATVEGKAQQIVNQTVYMNGLDRGAHELLLQAQMPYGTISITQIPFVIADDQMPEIRLAKMKHGASLDRKLLLEQTQLTASAHAQIVSFTLTVIKADATSQPTIFQRGAVFNSHTRMVFTALNAGDRLLFDQIKVKQNGKLVELPPYSLNMK